MRRRVAHAAFATVASVCALLAAWHGWRLQQARQLEREIAAAVAASGDAPAPFDAPRAVKLARATALAQRDGSHDAAFKAYGALVQQGQAEDALARLALFNLANLHLRQGLATEAMPMVELAKQRYRDLLRADPDDWDARVNLERALRAAPEEPGAQPVDENVPVERRSIRLRGMDAGDLP